MKLELLRTIIKDIRHLAAGARFSPQAKLSIFLPKLLSQLFILLPQVFVLLYKLFSYHESTMVTSIHPIPLAIGNAAINTKSIFTFLTFASLLFESPLFFFFTSFKSINESKFNRSNSPTALGFCFRYSRSLST